MKKTKKGQALVTLLIFSTLAIVMVSTAVALTITGSLKTSMFEDGLVTYQMAEGGAENAMLRILRNPSYTGETMSFGTGTVEITVNGTNPVIITSTANNGSYQRTIQVNLTDINGVVAVNSWKEIF